MTKLLKHATLNTHESRPDLVLHSCPPATWPTPTDLHPRNRRHQRNGPNPTRPLSPLKPPKSKPRPRASAGPRAAVGQQ